MKLILTGAMLAATALSGLNAHLVAVGSKPPTCAQQIVGRKLLGIGVVTMAKEQVGHKGSYLVKIASEKVNGGVAQMVLTQEQVCDFADSIQPSF